MCAKFGGVARSCSVLRPWPPACDRCSMLCARRQLRGGRPGSDTSLAARGRRLCRLTHPDHAEARARDDERKRVATPPCCDELPHWVHLSLREEEKVLPPLVFTPSRCLHEPGELRLGEGQQRADRLGFDIENPRHRIGFHPFVAQPQRDRVGVGEGLECLRAIHTATVRILPRGRLGSALPISRPVTDDHVQWAARVTRRRFLESRSWAGPERPWGPKPLIAGPWSADPTSSRLHATGSPAAAASSSPVTLV